MAKAQDDKIYSVLIMIQDSGSMAECNAIKHQNKLWLVPQWIDNPTTQTSKPERIICMDGLPYQAGGKVGNREFSYLLSSPIPTAVLYGPNPSQAADGFVVEMSPDIEFQRRIVTH